MYKKNQDRDIPIKDIYVIAEEKNITKESVDEALYHLARIETISYNVGDVIITMIEN